MLNTRIAMVQMCCKVGESSRNIDVIANFVNQASEKSVDIVCFPELSVSGYNTGDGFTQEAEPIPGPSTDKLAMIAIKNNLTFLAGILERDNGGVIFNTQVVFGPEGLIGTYRKTHAPTSEIGTWSQGSQLPIFSHSKVNYGIEICYDSHFPEVSTALATKGAEVIFLPHASLGITETADEKFDRWLRYVPARAYDNGVFVGICNQVGDNGAGRVFEGVTFVCDPRGKVIAKSKSNSQDEMLIVDLNASDLANTRLNPEEFFRHFRRGELYRNWESSQKTQ